MAGRRFRVEPTAPVGFGAGKNLLRANAISSFLPSNPARRLINHSHAQADEDFVTESFIEFHGEGCRMSSSGARQKPAIPDGGMADLKQDIPERLGMKAATQ